MYKDVSKQYFIFRCILVWKILPDHYFNIMTESFKLELTKTDFSQFLYGTLKEGVNYPLCSPYWYFYV